VRSTPRPSSTPNTVILSEAKDLNLGAGKKFGFKSSNDRPNAVTGAFMSLAE
jgi:hypothetical protein